LKTVNLLRIVAHQLNNYKGLVSEVTRLLREGGDLEKTSRADLFTATVAWPVYIKSKPRSHDCKSQPAEEKLVQDTVVYAKELHPYWTIAKLREKFDDWVIKFQADHSLASMTSQAILMQLNIQSFIETIGINLASILSKQD
jgi:hypothetical protein